MSSQTVVDVVISGTTATVVDAQVDGITTVAGAPQVTNVSGQIPDLGVTTSYLAGQGEILSLTNDIANLRANVIITGQTLTDEIGVLSGVLISTGNYLESNILTLSGDLIASGNNLDSLRDILSGNLITTGRVLEGQIQNSTIDISALQTATGTLQDQKFDKAGGTLSGNVIPSSSGTLSLGTADFPFKSGFFEDLTVSNNTLYVGEIAITATDAGGLDFESASGTTFFKDVSIRNLSVTGTETIIDVDNLAIKDNKIILNSGESGAGISLVTGGIIIDRGTLTDADLLFNEANDRFEFNFPLALEGNLAVTANQTGTYADAGNLITTGQTLTSEINTVSGLIIDNDSDITSLKTATGVLKTFTDDNAANLITTGQTLTTNINTVSTNLISTGSVVDDISGSLTTTGQTLTSEIGTVSGLITDNDGDITALKTATGVLKTSTDANTSNLITTGNFLTSEINIVSGLAGGSVIDELSGNLITTGQTLQVQITSNDSDISTLTSNLVTTGQTLTSEIATVSGIAEAHTDVTALSGKVDDISGNLIITGRTLTTDINTVSANLISTGAIIDDVSGNLITTGQTLQTQITSNDGDISTLTSNLITTGQTLTSEIIIVSGLTTGSASDPALSGKVDTLSGNLITTGQTLQTQITSNDGDISTLTTNLITTGQTLQTQITSNDTDISNLTSNVITTGQTLTSEIAIVSGIAESHTDVTALSGKVDDISGNLITTGQTLQTQITSNDGDITTLTSNLITTGQTLTSEIAIVSGIATGGSAEDFASLSGDLITTGQTLQTQITSNDSDISTLTSNLITTGQTLTTDINTVSTSLISTGAVVDDISGNLITTGQTLQTQITSNDSDISTLTSNLISTGSVVDDISGNLITTGQTLTTSINTNSSNLITTGQTLTSEIAIVSGIAEAHTDVSALSGKVDDISGNLITTGQTLQTQITSNDTDISNLTANLISTGTIVDDISGNLITTGQTLQTQITSNDGDITTLTSNLITTGQTLTSEIGTVSGLITDNDAEITALLAATGELKTDTNTNASNLITTGQTLTTNINTISTNLVSTGSVVDDISGNLITTGQTLQTQITSNDGDITNLTSNLITTGQTLTTEITTVSGLITDNDGDITALKAATGVLKTSTDNNTANLISTGAIVDDISGNLITTGQTLQTQITSNDSDISTLTSNLISTGSVVDDISGNLITTGQTLQTQITSNDSDISTLTSNLVTTGQTLTTNINTVSANLVSTGSVVDDISGNLITTGQTLQTQITSNDGDISTLTTNLGTTGQTLQTQITSNDADIATLDSTTVKLTTNQSVAGNKIFTDTVTINNLTVTGTEVIVDVENLAVRDNIIHINSGESGAGISRISGGVTIDRGTEPAANILYNDANDRFELNFPLATEGNVVASAANLITTGQTLTTNINTVSTNLVSTGSVVDDISGNLITTGQTLQTQITANDTDIATNVSNISSLTTNLVTTGQTLQTQITSNDSDISTLTSNLSTTNSNLVTTGQTLTTNINTVSTNLVSTGSIVDDISGNLITTGQTLQTQITSNDTDITNLSSNLVTTGQTLTTNINTVATNLVTTGQTLTSEIITVSGLIPATVIDGGGTANKVPLWSDANTIGDSVISQSSSKIGIGTATPEVPLEVVFSRGAKTSLTDIWGLRSENTGDVAGTQAGLTFIVNNASSARAWAGIYAEQTNTDDTSLKFWNEKANSRTVKMTINSDGNVGIGSENPAYKLDVRGDYIFVDDGKGIRFGGSSHQVTRETGNELRLKAANTTGFITFLTGGGTEYMRIAADGKVGIGTNAPSQLLHVWKAGILEPLFQSTTGRVGLQLSAGAVGDVSWILYSGYPAAGDFNIRESGVANHLVIKKTTGNATFSGDVTLSKATPQIIFTDTLTNPDKTWAVKVNANSLYITETGVADRLTIAAGGATTLNGVLTANAGINIDNINIDGTTLALSSGDLTIDVAGNISLDADGNNITLKDGGIDYGNFTKSSNDFVVQSTITNGDILFKGSDGGSAITALSLNMSEAGEATFNSDVFLKDNKNVRWGDGQDFRISFDGSNAIIYNAAANSDVYFKGNNGSQFTALTLDMSDAGTAIFNHDITLPDNGRAVFGAGSDLQIYHNASDSVIRDAGTGRLLVGASEFLVTNSTLSEAQIQSLENGAVTLSYDGSAKLATTSTGVSVTGQLDLSSHLDMPDNAWIKLGASDDLLITHDGSSSWIIDNGAGGLVLASDSLYIKNAAYNETGLSFIENGAVTLFYDNVAKIATTSSGINVTGGATVSGTLTAVASSLTGGGSSVGYSFGASGSTSSAANVFCPASYTVAFGTNNAERMRIASDGKVGIGVTDPDAKLEIKGTGGGNGLTFKTTDDASNEVFYVKDGGAVGLNYYPLLVGIPSSTAITGGKRFQIEEAGWLTVDNVGNVGIGTTAPSARLEVEDGGTASSVILKVTADDQTPYALMVGNDTYSTTDTDGIGMWINNAGQGKLHARGTGSQLILGAAGTNYVYLLSDGNVGIGIASPTTKLSVKSTGSNVDEISLVHSGNTVKLVSLGQESSHGSIHVRANSGVAQARISAVNSNYFLQNVGIGTTAPTYKLHVASNGGYLAYFQNTSATDYRPVGFTDENNAVVGSIGYNTTNNVFSVGDTTGPVVSLVGGKVGIGVTAPVAKLHIDDSATGDNKGLYIQNTHNTDGDSAAIRFGFAGNDNANKGGIFFKRTANYGRGSLIFATENNQTNDNVDASDAKLTILADGKVGIGTAAPASLLDVRGALGANGSAATPTAYFSNSTAAATSSSIYIGATSGTDWKIGKNVTGISGNTNFSISDHSNNRYFDIQSSTGNVGIGTAAPANNLHVKSSVSTGSTSLFIERNLGTYGLLITADNNGNSRLEAQGAVANLLFGIGGSEKLRISNNGKVGVGTTAPARLLHVYNNTASTASEIKIENSIAGYNAALQIKTTVSEWDVGSNILAAAGSFEVYERTGGSAGNRLTILSGGKVGIGTTAPGRNLHIKGALAANNTVAAKVENTGTGFAGVDLATDGTDWSILAWGSGTATPNQLSFYNGSTHPLAILSDGTLNLISAKFKINGSAGSSGQTLTTDGSGNISWSSAGSGTISGSGTDNYIPRWNGTAALQDSSMIALDDGRVGVGVAGPSAIFHVKKTDSSAYWLGKFEADGTTQNALVCSTDTTSGVGVRFDMGGGSGTFTVLNSGKVGIGTTAPDMPLVVKTTAAIQTMKLNGHHTGYGSSLQFDATDAGGLNFELVSGGSGTGGSMNSKFSIRDVANNAPRLTIDSVGNVGIGIATPSERLHIAESTSGSASIRITNSTTGTGSSSGLRVSLEADENTTIMNHSNTNLNLGVNGLNVISIKDAKVGIGTTAPANTLHVNGQTRLGSWAKIMHTGDSTQAGYIGSGADLAFGDSNDLCLRGTDSIKFTTNDGQSDAMTIDVNGKVGIGTTAPDNLLTLRSSVQFQQDLKFTVGNTTVPGGFMGAGGASENIWMSAGAELTGSDNSASGFTARNNDGGGAGKAAGIRLGDSAGTITFFTASSLTNGNTFTWDGGSETGAVMSILNDGKVGIGTTSPEAALTLAGPNYTHAIFRTNQSTASQRAGGGFSSLGHATATSRFARLFLDADGANFSGTDYFTIEKFGNSGEVKFLQYSNATMSFWVNTTTQAMTIKNDGNVGIGTNAPSGKLEVRVASETGTSSTHGIRIGTASNAVNIGASDSGYAWLQTRDADPLSLQPIGGNVGIGIVAPLDLLHLAAGGKMRIAKSGDASRYTQSEYAGVNTNANDGYSIKLGGTTKYKFINDKLGIGSTSPAAPLDVPRASDYKVIKLGDDITSHYVITGNADHTLTLTCASYFQAEIVITAHQTNGGTYNNLYMRGIWSNNHTSHHWDEIENVGDVEGSTFTITVGQNGATTNSGEWKIVHDYTSGSFVKFTVRVTDFYNTHSYTIS